MIAVVIVVKLTLGGRRTRLLLMKVVRRGDIARHCRADCHIAGESHGLFSFAASRLRDGHVMSSGGGGGGVSGGSRRLTVPAAAAAALVSVALGLAPKALGVTLTMLATVARANGGDHHV